MKTIWMLAANRAGAKILEKGGHEPLKLIESFENAEGKLQDKDLESDRPNAGFEKHISAHHQVARVFAKKICDFLEKNRAQNHFTHLCLMAEPSFLGLIQDQLSDQNNKILLATIKKDPQDFSHKRMSEEFDTVLNSL